MLRLHRITKTAASVSRARLKLLMLFAYEFKVREVRMRMMSQGLHQPSVSHLLTGIMEWVTGWFCLTRCRFIIL